MRFKNDSMVIFGGVTIAVLLITVLGAWTAHSAALFAIRLAAPPLNWGLGGTMAVLDHTRRRRLHFPLFCLAGALLTLGASLMLEWQLALHVPEYGGVALFIVAYSMAHTVLGRPPA